MFTQKISGMNKMAKWTIGVLVLLNVVLITLLIMGKPPRPHGSPRDFIIEKLELSNAQISAYDKLIDEHRTKMKQYDERIRGFKHELMSEVVSDNESKQDSLTSEIASNVKAIEKNNINHIKSIYKLLDESQMKRFNELKDEIVAVFGPRPPRP